MPAPSRVEHRVEDNVRAFLAPCPALSGWLLRERDDDRPLYDPKSGVPPRPVVVLVARDVGRVSLTPIRRVELEITWHANGKAPGGSAAALDAAVGAVEELLDGTNLQTALSGPTVAVMLARRQDGSNIHFDGLVRRATLRIDLRAVAAERTATA